MSDFNAALEKAKAIAAKLSKKSAEDSPTTTTSSIGVKRGLDEDDVERESKKPTPNPESLLVSSGIIPGGLVKEQHEVTIPNRLVGLVIGKGGETMKKLQKDLGVIIQFSPDDKQVDRVTYITGAPSDVNEAKRQIDEIISNALNPKTTPPVPPPGASTVEYQVPSNKVGLVIGKGGETIVSLQQRTGSKIFITPDSAADKNLPYRILTITGTDAQIAQARTLLDEVISQSNNLMLKNQQPNIPANSITDSFYVLNEKVGLIIGKGGETFKGIQTCYNVKLVIDTTPVPQGRLVSITGESEDVAYAKKYIEDKVSGINTSRFPSGYHKHSYDMYMDPFAQLQYNYYEDPYAGYGYYQPPPGTATSASQSPAPPTTTTAQKQDGYDYSNYDPNYYANDPNYAAWYQYYYGQQPQPTTTTDTQE